MSNTKLTKVIRALDASYAKVVKDLDSAGVPIEYAQQYWAEHSNAEDPKIQKAFNMLNIKGFTDEFPATRLGHKAIPAKEIIEAYKAQGTPPTETAIADPVDEIVDQELYQVYNSFTDKEETSFQEWLYNRITEIPPTQLKNFKPSSDSEVAKKSIELQYLRRKYGIDKEEEIINNIQEETIMENTMQEQTQSNPFNKALAGAPVPAEVTTVDYEQQTTSALNNFKYGTPAKSVGNPYETQLSEANHKAKKQKLEVVPTLNSAQTDAIQKALEADFNQKIEKTQLTRIDNILVRAPKASDLYGNLELTPVEFTKEALEKYEKNLVDTPANRQKFEEIKNIIANKTPVKPYLNDASRKYVGVVITTPEVTGNSRQNSSYILNNDKLVGFLVMSVHGKIPSVHTGLGVEITSVKAVESKKSERTTIAAAGSMPEQVPVLRWAGRAEAIKEGKDSVVSITEIDKNGLTREMTMGSELYFEVYATETVKDGVGREITRRKLNKKGQEVTRKVRLRGKTTQAPVLVLSALFKDSHMFEDTKVKGFISDAITADAPKQLATIVSNLDVKSDYLSDYKDILGNLIEEAAPQQLAHIDMM